MGSIAPEFLQRPAAPFPQAGPEEQLAAIQNWNMEYDALPPIVQWEPENDAAGTAWDLQEQQLDFMTKALDAEVSDHNKTRMRSQRYLIQSLAFERSLFKEQNYARYLNSLNHGLKMQVQDLKMQLQDEQARRLAAEAEKNGLLLQRDMETEYDVSCFRYYSRLF